MVKYRFVKLFEIINDVNDKLSSLDHQINEYFEFPNVEISYMKIFGQETGIYNAYVYVKAGDGFPSDKDMLSIKIDDRTGIFNQKFVNDIRARLKRGKVEVKFHPFSYILEAKFFLPNSITIKEIRVNFSILYENCKLRGIFLDNEPLKVEELEAVNKAYPKVIEEIKDFSLDKVFGKNCRYRYDSIDSI